MQSVSILQALESRDRHVASIPPARPVSKSGATRHSPRALRIAPAEMLDLASEAILLCDPASLRITCANQSASRLLGYSRARLCGRYLGEIVRDGAVAEQIATLMARRGSAEMLPWNGAVSTEIDGCINVDGTVRLLGAETRERLVAITLRAAGECSSKSCRSTVEQFDDLTGLPTRASLKQHLGHLLSKSRTSPAPFALLFVDLNGFKRVNDSFGHYVGDIVLARVAERLLRCTRPEDFIARYGGDEFVVVAPAVKCDADAAQIVRRIHQATTGPFVCGEVQAEISVSVGVSFCTGGEGDSIGRLIDAADRAMYREKRKLRG